MNDRIATCSHACQENRACVYDCDVDEPAEENMLLPDETKALDDFMAQIMEAVEDAAVELEHKLGQKYDFNVAYLLDDIATDVEDWTEEAIMGSDYEDDDIDYCQC
jgi:MinD superfamily P-loop ATPase